MERVEKEPEWHECNLTHEAVCPYCGHEHGDSWEWGGTERGETDGEAECDSCEREFFWSRDVSVTYSSQKKEAPDD